VCVCVCGVCMCVFVCVVCVCVYVSLCINMTKLLMSNNRIFFMHLILPAAL